jgi:hypothetical protein
VVAGVEERMQWGLKMCFKLLKRTQRLRGSVRDRRCAWRGDCGGAWVAAGLAWRARRTTAGRGKAAVGQGATRGICREQEVVLIGSQRR